MKKHKLACLLSLAMLSTAPFTAFAADEIDTDVSIEETSTLSEGESRVVAKIASDFEEFAGEDSEVLVEQLRTGEDLSYEVEVEQVVTDENGDPVLVEALDENGDPITVDVTDENGDPVMVEVTDENGNPVTVPVTDANGDPVMVQAMDENGEPMVDTNGDPIMVEQTEVLMEQATESLMVEQTEIVMETVLIENSNGQMGFGEVSLTLGLAESLLGDGASYADITNLLYGVDGGTGILDMRAEGMGWGEIFQSYDLSVGEVMKGIKSPQFVDMANIERGSSRKPEKVTQARFDKAGKPEKPVKAERVERPDRPEKASRPERPEKVERVERPERPEKPAKPDRPGKG